MPADRLARPSSTYRLSFLVEAASAVTVNDVRAYIYDEAEAVVVDGALGGALGNGTTQVEPYYDWSVPATAGDYKFSFEFLNGTLPQFEQGFVLVWPRTSKLDRYIERVKGWVQETEMGELQQALSLRDYRDALAAAVRDYSRKSPRLVQKDVSLTASQWEYDLSTLTAGASPAASWVNDFSRIVRIEPDVDSTLQSRYYEPLLQFSVDERRAKWRFENRSPSSGDTARVDWETTHTLSHSVDTLPTLDFEPLCEYAAGVVLENPQAVQWLRTRNPQIAGDFVSFDNKSRDAVMLGARLKKEAMKKFTPGRKVLYF